MEVGLHLPVDLPRSGRLNVGSVARFRSRNAAFKRRFGRKTFIEADPKPLDQFAWGQSLFLVSFPIRIFGSRERRQKPHFFAVVSLQRRTSRSRGTKREPSFAKRLLEQICELALSAALFIRSEDES